MRNLDWTKALSDEDVLWVRQAGFMSEDRIIAHQALFDAEVPEEEFTDDGLTNSALDPFARVAQPAEGTGDGAPFLVTPETPGDATDDEEDTGDDYDSWKVKELEDEVAARNDLENRKTEVQVIGTGKDGNVTKPDLVKGLRLWDQENPGVL